MDDELRQASERRLAVLDAYVKAQGEFPTLVAVVMSSADNASAQVAVAEHFGLSRELAVAILDIQVRRMSEQGRALIIEERDSLLAHLAGD